MSTRNTGRTKKYGVCLNDKCEKYKVPQEILHGNYECPECKKKLSPCAPPKEKNNKLPLIIGGAVAAVVIIGGGIFAFSGGSNEASESVVIDSLEADTIRTQTMPVPTDTVVVRDTLVERDTIVVRDTVVQKVAVGEKKSTKTTATGTASGTIRLSYGTWTGGYKNGQPHGQGTLTYSTSRTIDSRDPKGRVAQPGEYIIGEWDNGHLVQGRWFKKDGTKEVLIIGKAG